MEKSQRVVRLRHKKSEVATLTQKTVNSCMIRNSEYFIRDAKLRGFFLRVKPSGVKSFGVQARLFGKGQPIQRIIGTRDRFTLQEARVKAKEWLQSINEGNDPKHFDTSPVTPLDLLESYIRYRDLEPTTVKGYRFNFNKYLNKIKNTPCSQITSDMLISWYEKEKKEHPIAAERTFVTLKTVFRFGKTLRMIEEDATEIAGVVAKRPRETKNIKKLEQIYRNLPNFLSSFHSTEISDVMRDWIILVLTTGLRKKESMSIKWEQVFLKEKYFVIPKNKAKRYLIVPMIGITYDMFQSRDKKNIQNSPYVFSTDSSKPITDPRKALNRICGTAGIVNYSPHDLRRLFASVCDELSLSEEEIGRLLNHSTRSVTDLYINRSLENVRTKYRKVIDFMDRQIHFKENQSADAQIITATDLLRASFYGKVSPSPDPPVSAADVALEKHVQDAYWEG